MTTWTCTSISNPESSLAWGNTPSMLIVESISPMEMSRGSGSALLCCISFLLRNSLPPAHIHGNILYHHIRPFSSLLNERTDPNKTLPYRYHSTSKPQAPRPKIQDINPGFRFRYLTPCPSCSSIRSGPLELGRET